MLTNKKFFMSLVVLGVLIISGWSAKNNQEHVVHAADQNHQELQAKINELEEKYQRLEDIEQIKQVKARYFRYVDEKKWTDLANLFTDDAKIIADGAEYPGGGPAFAKMIGDLVGDAPTVHHGHMPEIEIIDKDNAKAVWAMEDLLTFPDKKGSPPGHNGYGQYHETYRKVNGVWKISSMELTRFRMDPLKNWDPNTDPVTGK
ncbi:nuclear transport factor 2 family protein [Paenibacillus sp. MBLB2552]|uniref:Nuclear transport factor 2 family protein n=1 Tax=Paenibacillus mellifer TaxID=2937794 RepID=A0A9X2BRY1_9BACL|nr:nuclear transport factor 2 family protein [Paenibacillus mellifer]MCK8489918.1 nuclear transport factor 2 family protein [Paenibacillus mellifer]